MFQWWRKRTRPRASALIAASLGWMLDAFDVMLYALVLPSLMAALQLDQRTSGSLQSLTLLSAAVGGLAFGVLADRWGRTRALMLSVLIYSVFTAACGFAQTAVQLAVFRICLGLGMGGEWASGAALVSETWPRSHRGKALGVHAELVGDRLRARDARELARAGRRRARLARGVLRRRAAGAASRSGFAPAWTSRACGATRARRRLRVSLAQALGGADAASSRSRSR